MFRQRQRGVNNDLDPSKQLPDANSTKYIIVLVIVYHFTTLTKFSSCFSTNASLYSRLVSVYVCFKSYIFFMMLTALEYCRYHYLMKREYLAECKVNSRCTS